MKQKTMESDVFDRQIWLELQRPAPVPILILTVTQFIKAKKLLPPLSFTNYL